jgi:acyl-CoA thioester hydrolase
VTVATLAVDYGHIEPVSVHFDDIDAMGVLHNARYALLLERAMITFWSRHGHSFEAGRPTTSDSFNVVKEFSITYLTPVRGTGEVAVHFWVEHLGTSSAVYAFRMLSLDGDTTFAVGRRVVVKLDAATLAPAPWTAQAHDIARRIAGPVLPAGAPAAVNGRKTHA